MCIFLLLAACVEALGAGFRVRGRVTDAATGEPVPGAVVRLDENYLWAVTDAQGRFSFEAVEAGTYPLETGSLGYATDTRNSPRRT